MGDYDPAVAAAGRLDVETYLVRLGLTDLDRRPSVESLRRLHAAHVERVPYENLEIQLGRSTTVDPVESAERILGRGRGGYCYHLNGAFSALLGALGYRVTRHVGGVQRTHLDPAGANAGHMAITVAGLPDETCPDGVWMVDVGLGAALHEPVPLRESTVRQGPFEFVVRRSDAVPAGWRLDNDRLGFFVGMDFRAEPAEIAEFAAMHEYFTTAPESGFVRVSIVQRRDAAGGDVLRGLVLTRLDGDVLPGTVLRSQAQWYDALAEIFGLSLEDVDESDRERLWERLLAAHEEYERGLSA
jgi:N-hydroxyarylamine O-acetyltransferase